MQLRNTVGRRESDGVECRRNKEDWWKRARSGRAGGGRFMYADGDAMRQECGRAIFARGETWIDRQDVWWWVLQ